jgi:mono/diheme cytochrome c family protein
MYTTFRFIKWFVLSIIILLFVFYIIGSILYNKKYDAPYPDIKASTDTTIIAHGKHLVFSSAHCVECHFKPGDSLKVINGEEVALAGGGFSFLFPGGIFYSHNISSDKETGIGGFTDAQIASSLRYSVKANGKILIPTMEYQDLSDEDLTAIVSYLRTIPPVKLKDPENDFNLLGKAVVAFVLRPVGPKVTPPKSVAPDTTVAYGKYLAGSVSNCKGCHTERDMSTGKYVGKELAGGKVEVLKEDPNKALFAPNITPDPQTGHIYNWSFEQFRNRFRQGKIIPQSIMPWGQFKHMNDTEVKAIWKYLQSVTPVVKNNGPVIQLVKK